MNKCSICYSDANPDNLKDGGVGLGSGEIQVGEISCSLKGLVGVLVVLVVGWLVGLVVEPKAGVVLAQAKGVALVECLTPGWLGLAMVRGGGLLVVVVVRRECQSW